jgi:hypothetical protein
MHHGSPIVRNSSPPHHLQRYDMVKKMKWQALALSVFSLASTACAPTPVADQPVVCWLAVSGQIIVVPPGVRNSRAFCAPISTWQPGSSFSESADQQGDTTPGGSPSTGAARHPMPLRGTQAPVLMATRQMPLRKKLWQVSLASIPAPHPAVRLQECEYDANEHGKH